MMFSKILGISWIVVVICGWIATYIYVNYVLWSKYDQLKHSYECYDTRKIMDYIEDHGHCNKRGPNQGLEVSYYRQGSLCLFKCDTIRCVKDVYIDTLINASYEIPFSECYTSVSYDYFKVNCSECSSDESREASAGALFFAIFGGIMGTLVAGFISACGIYCIDFESHGCSVTPEAPLAPLVSTTSSAPLAPLAPSVRTGPVIRIVPKSPTEPVTPEAPPAPKTPKKPKALTITIDDRKNNLRETVIIPVETNCPICLEDIIDIKQVAVIFKCRNSGSHLIHQTCLEQYEKTSGGHCFICRK